MTESETSTTSTPRPEIVDDVAAADDAPAVAGEPVAGDDSTTADTLTAAGEPAGDDALTAAGDPPRDDTANAAGPTTAGAGTVEADSIAVTLAARGESAVAADSTAGDEAAGTAIPAPASPTGTEASLTRPAPASSDAVASPSAATTQSGIALEFVHESWVEIYDRERARLFFGLVQPGRVLEFDGAQPFDVLLGFGKDVRVTIDGEAFDHTPYIKHGVARFKLGTPLSVEADTAGSTTAAEPGAATVSGTATVSGRSAADGETTDDTMASGGTSTSSP